MRNIIPNIQQAIGPHAKHVDLPRLRSRTALRLKIQLTKHAIIIGGRSGTLLSIYVLKMYLETFHDTKTL